MGKYTKETREILHGKARFDATGYQAGNFFISKMPTFRTGRKYFSGFYVFHIPSGYKIVARNVVKCQDAIACAEELSAMAESERWSAVSPFDTLLMNKNRNDFAQQARNICRKWEDKNTTREEISS